jgi:PAS domain S-box-containing protein
VETSRSHHRASSASARDALLLQGSQHGPSSTAAANDEEAPFSADEINQGMLALLADGTILYSNRWFAEILKTPAEAIVGCRLDSYVTPEDQIAFANLLDAGRNRGTAGEITLRTGDSNRVTLCLDLNPLPAEPATAICLLAAEVGQGGNKDAHLLKAMEELAEAHRSLAAKNRDLEGQIAERLHMEDEFRQREEAFRVLAENSPDEISRFDRDFRHLYVNRRRDRFLGKTLDESGYPEELIAVWKAQLQNVFETARPGMMEYEATAENGSRRFFQSRLVPEFAPEGEVDSVLIVSRDITLRKQAEEAAEQAKAKAERADRIKSELLLRLSEEMRALIEATVAFAKKLDNSTAEQSVSLAEILERVRHLFNLTNEVLEESTERSGANGNRTQA